MSNITLSWAFKCHVGNASAKAVLVYLADRADDEHGLRAGVADMAFEGP